VFDIGLQELIVIFLVALLVFGPKRLPELARSLGKGLGDLKRAFQDVKDQVETEFHETNETLGSVLEDKEHVPSDEKTDNKNQAPDKNPVEH
jgi:sec-independent protein translocase protein TatB